MKTEPCKARRIAVATVSLLLLAATGCAAPLHEIGEEHFRTESTAQPEVPSRPPAVQTKPGSSPPEIILTPLNDELPPDAVASNAK